MDLRKAERGALADLLMRGADERHGRKCPAWNDPDDACEGRGCLTGPEALAEDFVKLLDTLRGSRSHHYACAIVAGIPLTIGPYVTKAQAEKAIARFPAEKKWIVPGWTPEGWDAHLADVDAKPVKQEVSAAEQRKRGSLFWAKARPIMDNEADGLVLQERGTVQVKLLKKDHWG